MKSAAAAGSRPKSAPHTPYINTPMPFHCSIAVLSGLLTLLILLIGILLLTLPALKDQTIRKTKNQPLIARWNFLSSSPRADSPSASTSYSQSLRKLGYDLDHAAASGAGGAGEKSVMSPPPLGDKEDTAAENENVRKSVLRTQDGVKSTESFAPPKMQTLLVEKRPYAPPEPWETIGSHSYPGLPLPTISPASLSSGPQLQPQLQSQPQTQSQPQPISKSPSPNPPLNRSNSPETNLAAVPSSIIDFGYGFGVPPPPPAPLDESSLRRRSYTMDVEGVDVQGEILQANEGWTRHTRVYGGGVCQACLESERRGRAMMMAGGGEGLGA